MYNEDFLKTAGVFAIESGFDNNYIFTSLGFAQTLFDKKNYVSSYEIMVEDKENIEQTKEKIKGALGSDFLVLTDVEQRAGLYKILQTEKLVVYFVFFIVIKTGKRKDTVCASLLSVRECANRSFCTVKCCAEAFFGQN